MTGSREDRPRLSLIAGGAPTEPGQVRPIAPAEFDRSADDLESKALVLTVWAGLCREKAAEYRHQATELRASRHLAEVRASEDAEDWTSRQTTLFDEHEMSGSALRTNEHEGAAGQTSLFASGLNLGQDDDEIRGVDAARHASQVAEALDVLAHKHGPFTQREQLAMRRAVEHSGRTAARLDIMRELLSALWRERGQDDR